MSTDTQLPSVREEELLDFVVWLFDDAERDAVGTVENHRDLIRAYFKDKSPIKDWSL